MSQIGQDTSGSIEGSVKGKIVRAEAHRPLLAEERAHHVEERPLQIREREVAVDGEALELVEDREARRRDLVAAVDAAERDHVDRRRLRLHDVDLGRRRFRPEQADGIDEERVARRARRVRRAERELVEVVVDGLDLAVVDHLVAQAEKGVLDDPACQRRRVQRPEMPLLAGKRHVDDVLG